MLLQQTTSGTVKNSKEGSMESKELKLHRMTYANAIEKIARALRDYRNDDDQGDPVIHVNLIGDANSEEFLTVLSKIAGVLILTRAAPGTLSRVPLITAIRRYRPHGKVALSISIPAGTVRIWRYTSLVKSFYYLGRGSYNIMTHSVMEDNLRDDESL